MSPLIGARTSVYDSDSSALFNAASAAATAASALSNAATAVSRSRWLTSLWSNSAQNPLAIAARLLQARLLHTELRARAIDVGAKRRRIDAEQQLTGFHGLAFLVTAL